MLSWPSKSCYTQAPPAVPLCCRTVRPTVTLIQYEPGCGTVAGTCMAAKVTMTYLFIKRSLIRVSPVESTENSVTTLFIFWLMLSSFGPTQPSNTPPLFEMNDERNGCVDLTSWITSCTSCKRRGLVLVHGMNHAKACLSQPC